MEMIDILSRLKQIQENNPNSDVKDAISSVAKTNGVVDEKAKNPYAIGMAQAMKSTGDKPPLKKSTITKAHDIAKSIEKNEGELDETLTRQHFQLFADTVKQIENPKKREEIASFLADVFEKINPRFDIDKFYSAAGVIHQYKGLEPQGENEAADNKAELERKLDHLKQKYNAQMANAYAGDPDETEEEIAKIEKQLGITHEGKKMKKDKMNESIVIATDNPEEASMMMQLLKLAGVQPVGQDMINQPAASDDAQADEAYANTPKEKYSDIKAAVPNGTDLHREKGAYIKAAGGDNPMAIKMGESEITEEQLSNSLRAQYESFKQTYQEAAKAKPDFLDVDKDGNKTEPMKKALKDKEGK